MTTETSLLIGASSLPMKIQPAATMSKSPMVVHSPLGLTLLHKKGADMGLSQFRMHVLTSLCQIPAGKVTTYKDLARHVNCKSFQAIGQALRNNPFAPDVPCHRVVATDMSLGGFCGKRMGEAIERKRRLLMDEGVLFDGDRVEDSCIYRYE
jgi:methylated-DNA-[protein]-cysteine S-methyltransferase